MRITILGARGSVAMDGISMTEFGGATSCILLETDREAVFLDAGTGIVHAPDIGNRNISVLITHPHIDHIVGLPFFPYITQKDRRIDIFAVPRFESDTGSMLKRLISPPLWPLTLEEYKSNVVCHDINSDFNIRNIDVKCMDASHPGGVSVFRISDGIHSVVYATDCEIDEKEGEALAAFSKGADLIFLDAQYTDEEYSWRKGYGHSTVRQGLNIMKMSGAKSMRFIHHDPAHNDEMLRNMEKELTGDNTAFAREGEVISL